MLQVDAACRCSSRDELVRTGGMGSRASGPMGR
jgi:hypothetical protein